MYRQVHEPLTGSLGLSTIVAGLPLVTVFVLLAGLRLPGYRAVLVALAVALAIAIAVYGMPAAQALDSAAEGAAFGLFPIAWIVVNAVWIYRMTVTTGHFHALRRAVGAASDDQRIQVLIVA